MRVLVANNCGREAKRLVADFPERIGHIHSPTGWRGLSPAFPHFALDNGAFVHWRAKRPFDGPRFLAMCDRVRALGATPLWVAVPDVVMEREATIASWYEWAPRLREYGWPLAFVVQNGMEAADVPGEAAVVFVGGDTHWKRESARYWCERFPRVHIGRVNTEKWLWHFHRAGAESCDGSGWFRGDRAQLDGLWYYLTDTTGLERDAAHGPMQGRLFAMGA